MSKIKKYRVMRPSIDFKNRFSAHGPTTNLTNTNLRFRKEFTETFEKFGKRKIG